jgi:hypothetical protein
VNGDLFDTNVISEFARIRVHPSFFWPSDLQGKEEDG